MLSNLPVTRSIGARSVFLVTALITAVILIWIFRWRIHGPADGLAAIFSYLFLTQDYTAAMCALLILVAAVFVSVRHSFQPTLRWIGEHPGIIAAINLVVLSVGALTVYHNHPLSMDEYAAYFQSQAFAAGRLTGEFPPSLLNWLVPEGFQNFFLIVSHGTGQVASSYWPSFALLLTPFTWLGIPWVCNATISSLTLLAMNRLARKIFGNSESAGLAVLLTAASPVFFANGISYYSMSAHLLTNTLYALLLVQPTHRTAFAAGVVGSVALTLHNPVPHLLFALPWMLWIATRHGGIRITAWLSAGYVPLCLLLGVGWFWFSGELTHQDVVSGLSQSVGVERVTSAFALPSVTVFTARLVGVVKIWLWAVPGVMVLAVAGAWKWRHHPACLLLLTSALATLIGYLFVPADQGHGWGFRYFHSAWLALPILAAGALTKTAIPPDRPSLFEDPYTRTFIVACALLTLFAGNALRSVQIENFVAGQLVQMPAYAGVGQRVVIIDPTAAFYGYDLVQNDPLLRGDVIRMLTHGRDADTEMMRQHFPTLRKVHTDDFGTVWSSAVDITEVPLDAQGPAPTIAR